MRLPESRFEFTVLFWFFCTLMGLASHASQSYLSGKPISLKFTICHFILSASAGLLAVLVCCHYNLENDVSGIVCYIAGYGASNFIGAITKHFYINKFMEKD